VVELIPPNLADNGNHFFFLTAETFSSRSPLRPQKETALFSPPHLHDLARTEAVTAEHRCDGGDA
jgi:hypothetical protein